MIAVLKICICTFALFMKIRGGRVRILTRILFERIVKGLTHLNSPPTPYNIEKYLADTEFQKMSSSSSDGLDVLECRHPPYVKRTTNMSTAKNICQHFPTEMLAIERKKLY